MKTGDGSLITPVLDHRKADFDLRGPIALIQLLVRFL
jgi:hypothetical protein